MTRVSTEYLDQPMLTLSPDATQGSRAVLPSGTWMLSGALVIRTPAEGATVEGKKERDINSKHYIKILLCSEKSMTRDLGHLGL